MPKFAPIIIIIFIASLILSGCNQQQTAKAQNLTANSTLVANDNLRPFSNLGISPDSLIFVDTIPNAFSRRGTYLDSLQIQELIADKIPNRASLSYSSIRLFSVKELSDSLCVGVYVYEYSDIEDIYMVVYKDTAITDVLKLPIQEKSDIQDVIDGIEYIDYFESSVIFTDDSHFIVTELSTTKGWNNNEECVFKTSLKKETFYSISTDGQIHKEDVVKTQSCPGLAASFRPAYSLHNFVAPQPTRLWSSLFLVLPRTYPTPAPRQLSPSLSRFSRRTARLRRLSSPTPTHICRGVPPTLCLST